MEASEIAAWSGDSATSRSMQQLELTSPSFCRNIDRGWWRYLRYLWRGMDVCCGNWRHM